MESVRINGQVQKVRVMDVELSYLQQKILEIAGNNSQIQSENSPVKGTSFKRLTRALFPADKSEFFEDRNMSFYDDDTISESLPEELMKSLEGLGKMGLVTKVPNGRAIELTEKGNSYLPLLDSSLRYSVH